MYIHTQAPPHTHTHYKLPLDENSNCALTSTSMNPLNSFSVYVTLCNTHPTEALERAALKALKEPNLTASISKTEKHLINWDKNNTSWKKSKYLGSLLDIKQDIAGLASEIVALGTNHTKGNNGGHYQSVPCQYDLTKWLTDNTQRAWLQLKWHHSYQTPTAFLISPCASMESKLFSAVWYLSIFSVLYPVSQPFTNLPSSSRHLSPAKCGLQVQRG